MQPTNHLGAAEAGKEEVQHLIINDNYSSQVYSTSKSDSLSAAYIYCRRSSVHSTHPTWVVGSTTAEARSTNTTTTSQQQQSGKSILGLPFKQQRRDEILSFAREIQ